MDLAQLWADDEAPPPKLLDVLTHIAHFLDQLGYTKTFSALYKEAKKNNIIVDIAEWERGIQAKTAIPLLDLYEEWYDANDKHPTLPDSEDEDGGASVEASSDSDDEEESEKDAAEGVLVDVEAEETSDDDAEGDGTSDSDSDDERADATPSKSGVKRKRVETPSSSEDSSSDDSDSDSSESTSSRSGHHRPAKKTKVETSASSDSDSSSSDSDSDSSSSSSGSDSDSASGESASSSDSSDSDSSSNESEKEPKKQPVASKKKDQKKKKAMDPIKTHVPKTQTKDNGSTSSATLEAESAGEKEDESNGAGQVHPDRLRQMPPTTKKATAAAAKKQVVPFSRIPADQKVDARFSSNAYVSYDYADRAHRDLIVTKGKGFTKEKNKKKRGAYRGGAIDLAPKGIKFDD